MIVELQQSRYLAKCFCMYTLDYGCGNKKAVLCPFIHACMMSIKWRTVMSEVCDVSGRASDSSVCCCYALASVTLIKRRKLEICLSVLPGIWTGDLFIYQLRTTTWIPGRRLRSPIEIRKSGCLKRAGGRHRRRRLSLDHPALRRNQLEPTDALSLIDAISGNSIRDFRFRQSQELRR